MSHFRDFEHHFQVLKIIPNYIGDIQVGHLLTYGVPQKRWMLYSGTSIDNWIRTGGTPMT